VIGERLVQLTLPHVRRPGESGDPPEPAAEEPVRIRRASLRDAGGRPGLLQALRRAFGTIFPAPADAAPDALNPTFLLESRRRPGHGRKIARCRLGEKMRPIR
jgi:hypothetical protein